MIHDIMYNVLFIKDIICSFQALQNIHSTIIPDLVIKI